MLLTTHETKDKSVTFEMMARHWVFVIVSLVLFFLSSVIKFDKKRTNSTQRSQYVVPENIHTPPPREFHLRPSNPSGKVYFHEKDYQSKERYRLRLCNGFHLISLSDLELEHSKLPTMQYKLHNTAYPLK